MPTAAGEQEQDENRALLPTVTSIRRPPAQARGRSNEQRIVEGCYSDLIEAALPHCTELLFLNPGVEVRAAHSRRRPWEPEKFSSPEDQAAMLPHLVQWVREYGTRDDEYGLKRHREVFERFAGPKREFTSVEGYAAGQAAV